MSLCPTIDLHSVYVDGELPKEFLARYESHIKNCSLCQERLAAFQRLHSLMKADCDSITLSDAYKEQGFNRLQTKLRYSKNAHSAAGSWSSDDIILKQHSYNRMKRFSTGFYTYGARILAAAAIFAIAFTAGLKLSGSKSTSGTVSNNTVALLKPITRPRLQFRPDMAQGTTQNVYFTQGGYTGSFGSGFLQNGVAARAYSRPNDSFVDGTLFAGSIQESTSDNVEAFVIGAPNMSVNNQYYEAQGSHHFVEFADVDVFRPEFDPAYSEQQPSNQCDWATRLFKGPSNASGKMMQQRKGHHHE